MQVAIEGWNRAQGGEDKPPEITGADLDEMVSRNADWIARERMH